MEKIYFWINGKPLNPKVWDDKSKREEYRKWMEKKFSIKDARDWLQLNVKDFVNSFQRRHNFSAVAMIGELVPEYKFNPWEFKQVPKGWWGDAQNQKTYFNWLQKSLRIKAPADWYSIKSRQVHPVFLMQFENYQKMLEAMIPNYDFKPWKFLHVPKGWWEKRENQQLYMDYLGEQLGFTDPEDWYALKYDDVELSLMTLYGDSPVNLVRSFFPDFDYKTWKFDRVPRNWWDNPKNQREYIKDLGKELGFKKPQDWYKLRKDHLESRFAELYKNTPSIVVQTFFPDYK